MTRGILYKELQEHGWVVLLLWGVCGLALVGFMQGTDTEASPFVAFSNLVAIFGPLLSLAVINRLVVREYGGQTQLFLETLPVTRARIVAVKWMLGALWTLFPMAASLVATSVWGSGKVLLTTRFVTLLAVRSLSFLLCFHSLAFVIGLLGRYRFVAWGALVVGLFTLDSYAQLPVWQLPPLELVASTMALERLTLPMFDLAVTWSMTALLLIGAFAVALAGEGSLSAFLARRMTHREKVVVAVAALLPLALIAMLDHRKPKPDFQLLDAIVADHGSQRVAIAHTASLSYDAARSYGAVIARDLSDLRDYLRLGRVPTVHVLPDASLDGDVFLRATLPASDGVVVRGALGSSRFEADEFRTFVVGEVLNWYTRGRATKEDRCWFLDGFTQWWMAERIPSLQERLRPRATASSVRIAYGRDALQSWLTTREQLGDCLGDALAWRAVSVLAAEAGPERLRGLARALWARRPPSDARVLLEPSFARLLERTTGFTLERLEESLSATPSGDRPGLPDSVADVSSWSASFESRPVHGRQYEIGYRFRSTGGLVPSFTVRYASLQPWDGEMGSIDLRRVDATHDGVLPLTVERGVRLLAAVEARDEELQCTVRVGARRWVVP